MNEGITPDQTLGASFRDPSGFLFTQAGCLYRQVNLIYQQHYDQLMASGLYTDLTKKGLLIPHQEANLSLARSPAVYKILQPQPVGFISYPYEWCFSELKDAALATLEIQKRAVDFGMSLKDSSAYNIQFYQGKPVLIDTLSFEIYQEGQPWIAYRQFCQHFLAPLSLMAYQDVRLNQLLRVYLDGIPLDLAARLLPFKGRLNFGLLMHIYLHAASQKRYASHTVEDSSKMSKVSFLGLIDSLQSAIQGLKWAAVDTPWVEYYDEHNYTQAGFEQKQALVSEWIEQTRPDSLWDLGANTGLFSRLASAEGIPTVAFDIDPAAVEKNYLQSKRQHENSLLPLVMDLTNPSPAIGWDNQERMPLLERGPVQMALALALVHHLAIGNNVPLDRLAAFFKRLTRWLVIEFVPKSDSQVQRLLSTRQDIFPDYTVEGFENAFAQHFQVVKSMQVKDSTRCLYLLESRSK